ncbi:hypothetical protein SUSAZ_02920 [Sulfolobus acidocaldarius SUSAZ]|nr:hypothetical protein SUSAZ_02920 [Sulfolobus acidocaldarius SUSAZ]
MVTNSCLEVDDKYSVLLFKVVNGRPYISENLGILHMVAVLVYPKKV